MPSRSSDSSVAYPDGMAELINQLEDEISFDIAEEDTPAMDDDSFARMIASAPEPIARPIVSETTSPFEMPTWTRRAAAPSQPQSAYRAWRDNPPHAGSTSDDTSFLGDEMLVGTFYGRSPDHSTLTPHPMVVGTHRVGVEIELENITTNLGRGSRYWQQIADGSLRNHGAEFIFRAPFGGVDLFNAMVEIDSHLHKLNPDDSQRCSTHVHVDVRDMTVAQLKNMILIYAVYERVLFQCSGWHRYRNNFCVALGFAQTMMKALSQHWHESDENFLRGVTGRWDKYTALNLLPMIDKGSVEFRISEAKWRKGQLLRLCNRFLSLKELAMAWEGSQEELIEHLMQTPVSQVLRKSLPRNLEDMTGEVEMGAKLAYDIIYVHKMPTPTPPPSTVTDIFHLTNVHGPADRLINARSNSAAWDFVRNHIMTSDTHRRRFGTDIPERQPRQMTLSFLGCVVDHLGGDANWFLASARVPGGDQSPREMYASYRLWQREQI